MKRFWTDVDAVAEAGGWGITLDGKPLRTPARAPLVVPTEGLAENIAAEWRAAADTVDPRAMVLTGLANAAIDRVAPDRAEFAADLARYAAGDLTCYRAREPQPLVERQASAWDPLLAWARRRFDVDFAMTDGLMHIAQPSATVEQLAHAVATLDPFRLAALSPLVTISGSLIAALAVVENAWTVAAAWRAVTIDDDWQREQWGDDADAEAALAGRKRDFFAAANFCALLDR